ncbi:MAG: zf-HC2 domain-containing protein [Candidatus Acidiferrum sp.]
MNLDCKSVWGYISEYIDDRLEPSVLAAMESHLKNCEVCSAVLDSTRNVLVLTADNRTFELPVGFSERLHQRLNAVIHTHRRDD